MYIDPGTDIYLCQSVPLDNTYENTIVFPTPTDQFEFFVNHPLYNTKHYLNQTYQRLERGYMMLQAKADEIVGYNYCVFRNTRYSNKWWYAFVNRVEWVNNEVARVDIEIDVMQTWYFLTVLDSCFVERQHASHDVAGDNLIPEGFELGDYVSDGVERFTHRLSDLCIVVASPYQVDVSEDAHWGEMYSNMFSGVKYKTFDATVNGAHQAGFYINNRFAADPSRVVSVFMCPSYIANNGSNPAADNEHIISPSYGEGVDKYSASNGSDIYGFTFHNQKLLTYPYCFLYVSNNTGDAAAFHYEYFSGNRCTFLVYPSMSVSPAALLIPTMYKGATHNWDEGLQIAGWPQCAYTTDTFRAYAAQISAGAAGGLFSAAAGELGGIGVASLAAAAGPAAGAFVGAEVASELVNTIGSLISAKVRSEISPTRAHGSMGSSPYMSAGMLDFTIMHKRIQPQFAKIIDGYWDAYGYPQRMEMVPDRTARRYFTYVKTIGCHVRGNISAEANRKICSIYDRGVRFWKPDARYIGDVADMAAENVPTP